MEALERTGHVQPRLGSELKLITLGLAIGLHFEDDHGGALADRCRRNGLLVA